MRRAFVPLLIALAAGLVLTATAASRVLSNGGTAPPDATGDSGTAPDITTLEMANDDNGMLTWKIGLGNRSQWFKPDYLQIPIDADRQDATGPAGGFEYLIEADTENGTRLFHFEGLDYVDVPSKTLASSFADGVLTISIDFREIGSESPRFYFYADTAPQESDDFYDVAPEGTASYVFGVKVPLLLDTYKPPRTVRAGAALPVSIGVWTDDANSPAVTCKAKAGKKSVVGKKSWASVTIISPQGPLLAYKGFVSCRFAVPKALRGKTLAVTMTLQKEGVTLREAFSKKIR